MGKAKIKKGGKKLEHCWCCYEYRDRENGQFIHELIFVCNACLREHYVPCSVCGSMTNRRNAAIVRGLPRCNYCYISLGEVSDGFPRFHIEHKNDTDESQHITGIHGHNYKPLPHFLPKNEEGALFFGLELEIDEGNLRDCVSELLSISENESLFYLKRDGSLSMEGVEIVSHPATLEFFKEKFPVKEISEIAIRNGYKSHISDNCGLHIHVSRNFFSRIDEIKLGMFIFSQKENMEIIGRREESSYAKFEKKNSFLAMNTNVDRREAVNFMNSNTIEFRFFKGTLNPIIILASIEFTDAVCRWVKTVNCNQIMSVKSWNMFCSYILENKKRYSNLIPFLRGRRLLQRR